MASYIKRFKFLQKCLVNTQGSLPLKQGPDCRYLRAFQTHTLTLSPLTSLVLPLSTTYERKIIINIPKI